MMTVLVRRSFAVAMPARLVNTQVFEVMLALPSQPKVAHVELHIGRLADLRVGERPLQDADGQPVLRGARMHMVGGGKPAGAGHVLHDHARVARDMLAEMAREIAGIEIEAAAGGGRRR